MTLLAALRCRGGIILGSDSQETRGPEGRRLARQIPKLYVLRPGFLVAWAGYQDVAQNFTLRLERATHLSPGDDRFDVKSRLHEILGNVRDDPTVEGRSDFAEFLIAWFSGPARKAVAVHLRSSGAGEWVGHWAFGGARLGVEIADIATSTLRFIDVTDLSLEQGKIRHAQGAARHDRQRRRGHRRRGAAGDGE